MAKFKKLFRKKSEQSPIAKELLQDYSERTTLHGIRYIGDNSRSLLEHIWWFISVLASIIVCSFFIKNIIDKLDRTPVMVTFADKSMSVIDIPVPSITICPQNKFRRNLINMTYIIERAKFGQNSSNQQNYEYFDIHQDVIGQVCQAQLTKRFSKVFTPIASYNIEDWLHKLQHDIGDLIMYCYSSDMGRLPCPLIFREVYTEAGLCFNLNSLSPRELYRDGLLYNKRNPFLLDLNSTWSPEDGYKNRIAENNYPWNALGGIFGDKIFLILNQKRSDLEPLCSFFNGFKVFMHSPSDNPIMKEEFIKLPANSDVRIGIEPKVIITSDELKKYSPEKRGCYFSYERDLKFFKIYSEDNCWLECLTNYTEIFCGCSFFYMPRFNGTRVCGAGSTKCLEEARNFIKDVTIGYYANSTTKCNCLPSCRSISYHVDATHSTADNKYILKRLGFLNETDIKDSMLVIFTAYFKTANFYPLKRSELFSFTDLIASCGGLLGLFMGFSLLSLIEIIYYCTIRPLLVWRHRNQNKKAKDRKHSKLAFGKNVSTIRLRHHKKFKIEEWQNIKFIKAPTYKKKDF